MTEIVISLVVLVGITSLAASRAIFLYRKHKAHLYRELDRSLKHQEMLLGQLEQIKKKVEVEEGPFYSARIRFPRRLKRFEISGDLLSRWHIHKMVPKAVVHLSHLLKEFSDLPESAMLYSADANLNSNTWTLVFQDESFEENEQGMDIPVGHLAMMSLSDVHLMVDCPRCLMNSMEKSAKATPSEDRSPF